MTPTTAVKVAFWAFLQSLGQGLRLPTELLGEQPWWYDNADRLWRVLDRHRSTVAEMGKSLQDRANSLSLVACFLAAQSSHWQAY